MNNESLGKRIARLRKEIGLKQEDISEKLSVSPQAVSKWENDNTCPDIALLPGLAKLLGVSVDVLLCGEKAEAPLVTMIPPEAREDINEMMLRIIVDSSDGDKVRVNLPMALVKMGLDMGMEMPQFKGSSALKNIDLNKVMEMIEKGAIGNIIEVDSADGDKVRLFVE